MVALPTFTAEKAGQALRPSRQNLARRIPLIKLSLARDHWWRCPMSFRSTGRQGCGSGIAACRKTASVLRLPAALLTRIRRGRAAGPGAHGRPHHGGRARPPHPPGSQRLRTRHPPRRLDAPARALRARLWLAVRPPYPAGQ